MGQQTKIEWTDHTFNPWRGCTKISPGCTNCYAEKLSHRNPRVLGEWGPNGTRVVASESMWRQPIKWNADAEAAGERRRVFCASLADVFEDRDELEAPRSRLWQLMRWTPHLDWLLLTKRPEVAREWINFLPLPRNAWLGVSVEDQQRADERIPELLKIPASVRFLSVEPLLGPVDLGPWMRTQAAHACEHFRPSTSAPKFCKCGAGEQYHADPLFDRTGIDWVIIGGESGPKARPCYIPHIRSLRAQCRAFDVATFIKQLGSEPHEVCGMTTRRVKLSDPKGGDWLEWPEELQIRQFPIQETT
jgi:protein gp37